MNISVEPATGTQTRSLNDERTRGHRLIASSPGPDAIGRAKVELTVVGVLFAFFVLVLATVIGVRIHHMASQTGIGEPFAVLMATLVSLAILIGMTWLVYTYSRGNHLGDCLKTLGEAASETQDIAKELQAGARSGIQTIDDIRQQAQKCLLEADAHYGHEFANHLAGLQGAAQVLGLKRMPAPSHHDLYKIPEPLRDAVQPNLQAAALRADELKARLEAVTLSLPTGPDSPFANTYPEHQANADPAWIDEPALQTLGYAGTAPSPRRRQGLLVLAAVLAFSLLAGLALLALTASDDANAEPPAPAATVEGNTPAPIPSSIPSQGAVEKGNLVEGTDYSFMAQFEGNPVRWTCGDNITVRLTGPSPSGTDAALSTAVSALREASGLPLVTADAAPHPFDRPETAPPGEISVKYAPQSEVLAISGSPDAVGVGGPRWTKGTVTSGFVIIDAEHSSTDPNTPFGQHVLVHELAHALGVGHSADGRPELMRPKDAPLEGQNSFGHGDLYALQEVGCPRS
ncbi:hypothetical protein [Arthrobacter sp. HS15c]|uniref:hypothetical protein n=1 Tax=Arthrobacter sp. HS15c TaxID=3230279 RepID=UPI0034652937